QIDDISADLATGHLRLTGRGLHQAHDAIVPQELAARHALRTEGIEKRRTAGAGKAVLHNRNIDIAAIESEIDLRVCCHGPTRIVEAAPNTIIAKQIAFRIADGVDDALPQEEIFTAERDGESRIESRKAR